MVIYPNYLDSEANLSVVPTSGKAILPAAAAVIRRLADMAAATEMAMGLNPGGLVNPPATADNTVQGVLLSRFRFELGFFTTLASGTQWVTFTHTTNGGTDQRFGPLASDGVPAMFFGNYSTSTGIIESDKFYAPTYAHEIIQFGTDAGGYPYRFQIESAGVESAWYLAVQSWEKQ
jgi:hypothetical protein